MANEKEYIILGKNKISTNGGGGDWLDIRNRAAVREALLDSTTQKKEPW
jgi:hypothetical protein